MSAGRANASRSEASPPPGRRGVTVALVLIPASLGLFWLVDCTGFPRRLGRWLLGPPDHPDPGASAPPCLEWDIVTMLFLVAVCGCAALYLLVTGIRLLLGRRG